MVHKTILVGALALFTAGCSSFMNIGESKLSGPIPTGIQCGDVMTAFELTNGNMDTNVDYCNPKNKGKAASSGNVMPFDGMTIPDINPIDEPRPILAPAKVMRVWVNAYEAADGSLVYPSRVFTEVTPRRWNVGYVSAQGADTNRVLSPLTADIREVEEPEMDDTRDLEVNPKQTDEQKQKAQSAQQVVEQAEQQAEEQSVQMMNNQPPLQ